MSPKDYDRAVEHLARLVGLSDEALHIAEGWTLLPDRARRHVKLLIDDHIAQIIPELRQLYENASRPDQERANRVIERAQARRRGPPSPAR